MRIFSQPAEFASHGKPLSLAIGVFDGVHLGHQSVIRQSLNDAAAQNGLAVAATFDLHPNAIVAPHRTPPLIYSLPQRLRVIHSLGVHAIWLIHFDRPFSRQPAQTFVRNLLRQFPSLHSICVGETFTFGYKRSGNVPFLRQLGAELGFAVHGLPQVTIGPATVSSTAIRQAIQHGNLAQAAQMLGRPYSLAGRVVHGNHLGRSLGFPTANIDTSGLILPPNGVYAAQAQLNHHSHPAVVNIGLRPTLAQPLTQPRPQVEVHLLDFNDNIYDQEIELTFAQRLRDELTFPSFQALSQQITRDIASARSILQT